MASEQTALAISSPGSLTAFRWCSYDVPFWARNNTRDGRWNRAGDPPTQYWSLCPEAAWAELIRAEDLHSEQELDHVRMPLWVCRVPMAGLIDLREPAQQEQWGLDDSALTRDDWQPTQAAANRLRRQAKGIITFCTALEGHGNITLFGPKRAIDWHSRPALASTVPTTLTAIGRPPPGLLAKVQRPEGPMPQERLF